MARRLRLNGARLRRLVAVKVVVGGSVEAVGIALFIIVGLLLVFLGRPLATRKVNPNGFYGLRTRATLEDEHIWFEANAASGKELMILGAAICVVVGASWLLGWDSDEIVLIGAVLLLFGSVLTAVRGISLANRLWAERHSD